MVIGKLKRSKSADLNEAECRTVCSEINRLINSG
jgi:hypothetical protein